jgi:two-component system NtrC family sensor kinase
MKTSNLVPTAPAGMTTKRRWLLTLVGFVAVSSLLEISVGSGLAFHFGSRVIGRGWLEGVTKHEIPFFFDAVHAEMRTTAQVVVADPRVLAALQLTPAELALAMKEVLPVPQGYVWIIESTGAATLSSNTSCSENALPPGAPPRAPISASDSVVAWCERDAFIGVTVPFASGRFFYGRPLNDETLRALQPITTTELTLVRGDGVVIATTMRAPNGDEAIRFPSDLVGFAVVPAVLAEPYRGLPSPMPDEDKPGFGAKEMSWLTQRAPFGMPSTHPLDLIAFVPERSLTEGTTSAAVLMLIIALFVVICAFFVARRIVASFTKPLTDIADAARRVASGETNISVAEHGDADVASLARSFNRMVIDLNASRATLMRKEKMTAVGQLASGIAHEINTPAQFVGDNITFVSESVQDIVDTMNAGQPMSAEQMETLAQWVPSALDSAREGVRRVAAIVGAMRSFAQPSNGKKEMTSLRDLALVASEVTRNEWRHVATLDVDIDEDLTVPAVRDELGQVFLHLIVNSAHALHDRHGASGGMGSISIHGERKGAFAELTVSDDGAGIAQEHLSRVFDAFFTTKPVGKGTGQGLSVAWSTVVDDHGGSMDVQSTVGSGTKFTIRLPLAPADIDANGLNSTDAEVSCP